MARIRRRTAVGFELELLTTLPFALAKKVWKDILGLSSGAFSPTGGGQESSARAYQNPSEMVSLLRGIEALLEYLPAPDRSRSQPESRCLTHAEKKTYDP
jgi:hypothetical protein